MTKQEYADYQAAVAAFMQREGLSNLTPISQGEGLTEPFFGKFPCECCDRGEAGDRYDCNGFKPASKEVGEYTVCADCVYYAEYGRLDDATMREVEESV